VFVYWIEYDGQDGRVKGREGYFNIDPVLRAKRRSAILAPDHTVYTPGKGAIVSDEKTHIPLDGLSILTLVSKWMGALEEWEPFYKEASGRGYNMIHYTPLQQCGQSKSPYSIADQLAYDRNLFDVQWKGSKDEGTLAVWETLKKARDQYGLMSLTDVVLNHTADTSEWLQEHPEAGYSPFNTPHLAPALEIDDAMIEFSGSLKANDLPTTITSQGDIDMLIGAFQDVLIGRNLWQYYVIDVAKETKAVRHALSAVTIPSWNGPDVQGKSHVELANLLRVDGKVQNLGAFSSRFCVTVSPDVAASLLKAAYPEFDDVTLVESWSKVLDILNVPLYEEWKEDTKVAIDNMRNRIKYTRLDEHGPKLGPISTKSVYFK
jgi:glycogen debranching enzyme